jgi:hypothetical protein
MEELPASRVHGIDATGKQVLNFPPAPPALE